MNSAHNARITEELLAQATMDAVSATEKQLDREIAAIDVNDKKSLEALRERRLEELKRRQAEEQQLLLHGHMEYEELQNEKDWFEASKNSPLMVTHFYRPATWRCEIIDKHLSAMSKNKDYIRTRFVKINAENCQFLATRLNIVLLPTLIMTKNNFTHDRIEGFDELGGYDEFPLEVLERRLAKNGMIEYDFEMADYNKKKAAEKKANQAKSSNANNKDGKTVYQNRLLQLDSDEDFSD